MGLFHIKAVTTKTSVTKPATITAEDNIVTDSLPNHCHHQLTHMGLEVLSHFIGGCFNHCLLELCFEGQLKIEWALKKKGKG